MIRLAIIGCGVHSRVAHAIPMARFAREHPEVLELAAACDLQVDKARRFCADFGFANAYASVDQMLAAERPDACAAIVPETHTPDLVQKLLEARIPCVVEKPLGASLADLRRLAEATRRTGTPHMVSVNRRFMPHLNRALAWARRQGPVHHIRAAMSRYDRAEDCFFWATGLHAVDAMRHLGGEAAHYAGHCRRVGRRAMDWRWIDFRFAGGATGRLDLLPTTGQEEETYELYGEDFCARVTSYNERGTSVRCWRDGKLEIDEASPPGQPQDVFRGEYDEIVRFATALDEGRPLWPTIADVAPSQEICFDLAGMGVEEGR